MGGLNMGKTVEFFSFVGGVSNTNEETAKRGKKRKTKSEKLKKP